VARRRPRQNRQPPPHEQNRRAAAVGLHQQWRKAPSGLRTPPTQHLPSRRNQGPRWRNPGLESQAASARFPPVRRATLEAQQRSNGSGRRLLAATKTNPASVGSGDCLGRDEALLRTVLLVVDPSRTRGVAAALKWYLAFRGTGGCDGGIVVMYIISGFSPKESARSLADAIQSRSAKAKLSDYGRDQCRGSPPFAAAPSRYVSSS
jgi:hypothetical protein